MQELQQPCCLVWQQGQPGAPLCSVLFPHEKCWLQHPAGKCHRRAPWRLDSSSLCLSPRSPFSPWRAGCQHAGGSGCGAAVGLCSGSWLPSFGGRQASQPRPPRGCCPLSRCAAVARRAACTVGRSLSVWPIHRYRQSRSDAGTPPHRWRFPGHPGRWGIGHLLLPFLMALPAVAGSCCPV